ncbi:MAG: dTDP-4-dehydrorhamnose reductase [Eubacteriales bacterium]|nr:dTDP-4-dehydrorhamnose reductase [Eubacteriales bacterium]
MRIFVTGANGQFGRDVVTALLDRGHEAVASDIGPAFAGERESVYAYLPLDITDRAAVREAIVQAKPDAVIHCAAWTAVDLAEDEPEAARAVNAGGTQNVALACKEAGCRMLYLSTDYVFGGEGEQPWSPECEDFAPLNVYGQTKLEGERFVRDILQSYFIVRIAWVFGLHGKNFVRAMVGAGKAREEVRVVCDQIGTPTYTADLAPLLVELCASQRYGVYHATNEGGYISWYEFCCEIYRQCGLQTRVVPVTTQEYGLSRAKRPANSRLDKAKLRENGFSPLPDWKDALARYLREAQL